MADFRERFGTQGDGSQPPSHQHSRDGGRREGSQSADARLRERTRLWHDTTAATQQPDEKKDHNWEEWKKETFDVYAKQVERLHTLYKIFEEKRGKYRTKESIQEFNAFAREFNEVHLKACAAQLDSINDAIHLHNDSQPEKLPIQKLPQEVKPISTSWKRAIIDGMGSVVVTGLALTQLVDPVFAQSRSALVEVNGDSSLREPMYLDHLVKPPEDQHKDAFWKRMTDTCSFLDTLSIPDVSNAMLISQTDNAKVYAVGNSTDPNLHSGPGPRENTSQYDITNTAKTIAQAVETDNAYLANIFGGIKPDGLPFTIYTLSHSDLGIGSNTYLAFHEEECSNTTIFVSADQYSPASTAAEMVEVYEAAINNGWKCNCTNGEALSRALAAELYPEYGSSLSPTESGWWNNGAIDYISSNAAKDCNQDANGCGTLFLGYLHDELGYDWKTIAGAGGNTLAETYSNLLHNDSRSDFSNDPRAAFQNFKKALEPFVIAGKWLVPPHTGESWDSQAKKLKAKIIGGSVGGGVGLIALGGGAVYWRRRRQQRAHRDTNQQEETELGTVAQALSTDNPA